MLVKVKLEKASRGRIVALDAQAQIPIMIKIIPIKFRKMVEHLGYIDVKDSKRLTLSAIERTLIFLHSSEIFTHLERMYPSFNKKEIEITAKCLYKYRNGEPDRYTVSVLGATDVEIPRSYYKKLKIKETKTCKA